MSTPVTTLVFDAGNTLIREDARYTGSMADWPELSAVDGVHEALQELAGQYRLTIASNAQISNAPKVHQANRRIGIDNYFEDIFTARDLGVSKPDLSFFRTIENHLNAAPQQLVMIGDGYTNDVLGAAQAGWQAVWVNPHHQACTSLTPLHSAEIDHMALLPSAIASLGLPTVDQSLFWLRQHGASFNLLQHVQTVAACAYQVALWLREAGHSIDPVLTHRGALLHDLGKIKTIRGQSNGLNHGELAARILNDLGYPQLAEIALRHLLFSIDHPQSAPQTLEQKLVYFCDKIVEGSQVVPLKQRIDQLRQRYPHDDARIAGCLPALQSMQIELCNAMHIPVEDLIPRLRKSLLEN